MKIKQALELFKYNCSNKISIVMLYDDGSDEDKLKPILYRDMSYSQIKDLLDYEVYSIYIEYEYDKPYFKITYCDPYGEWK